MKNLFKSHQSAERKEKFRRTWQYLKPWQKASLFLRAMWWSMPTVLDRLERVHHRVNKWITYYLYPAHWIGTR